MPTVPSYDNFQVTPNTLPQARMAMPKAVEMPDVAGKQAQQLGGAMQQAGGELGKLALDMAQEANQVRIDDALNSLKEEQLRLTYDKSTGFTNIKGYDALNRPGGKALADEFHDRLKQRAEAIMAGLGNDAQRAAFSAHAGGMLTSFKGGALQHESQEFKVHSLSVAEGIQATALREISLGYRNPEVVAAAVARIRAETFRQAQFLGKSAEWQEAQARQMTSNAHKTALLAALEENNPDYANSYLHKYKDQMEADDILAVKGRVDKAIDLQVGSARGAALVTQFQSGLTPTHIDRAFNLLTVQESGQRQLDARGRPLTSSAGAVGIAQIMPATARAVAQKHGVAWDEQKYKTDANYNATLGKLHFQDKVRQYGNLAQAFAAYNCGEKWVDEAKAKAARAAPGTPQAEWFWQLNNDRRSAKNRAETQNYVTNLMRRFGSGGGAAPRPTMADIDAGLRAQPDLVARPLALKAAQEAAAHQFTLQTQAIKQREEEAVVAAMRGVLENGGRVSVLPEAVLNAVPPKEMDNLLAFAQKISKGEDTTNPVAYMKLSDPQYLHGLNDNQFYALRAHLSESDFKHFAAERGKRKNGGGPGGADDLNSQAIKQELDNRLRMLKIDPTPKDDGGPDAARIGAVRQFVNQYMAAQQREAGKKFSDAEVAQHLDSLFAKNVQFAGIFKTWRAPMLGMTVGNIDSPSRQALMQAFKAQGVEDPTDAQLLHAYFMLQSKRAPASAPARYEGDRLVRRTSPGGRP